MTTIRYKAQFEPMAFFGTAVGALIAVVPFLNNWLRFGLVEWEWLPFGFGLSFLCFYVMWDNRLRIEDDLIVFKGAFESKKVMVPSDVRFRAVRGGVLASTRHKPATIFVTSKSKAFQPFNIPARMYTAESMESFLTLCFEMGVDMGSKIQKKDNDYR